MEERAEPRAREKWAEEQERRAEQSAARAEVGREEPSKSRQKLAPAMGEPGGGGGA